MRLIQSIVGVVLSLGFITFLFLIAWYIALPVLALLFLLGLLGVFKNNRFSLKVTPEFMIRRRQTKTPKEEKIIDVDYTEVP